MPAGDRSKWLDDGLHMTELAYDTIGEMVAAEISKRTCAIPTNSNSS
jgi:lysophospholipase L1-like esterase